MLSCCLILVCTKRSGRETANEGKTKWLGEGLKNIAQYNLIGFISGTYAVVEFRDLTVKYIFRVFYLMLPDVLNVFSTLNIANFASL